ncbi:MAG: hypothetical protein KY428_05990 [Bacteroidetes bacterium]|nr:hypothetical protein [Bacteroidota bacterium]
MGSDECRMKFWKNPEIVKYTPVITTLLLETSTLSHIATMWVKGTAAGQSMLGWLLVFTALLLWYNWYSVFTPDQKFAKY